MTDLRQKLEESVKDWPCLHCEFRSRPRDDGYSVQRCQSINSAHFTKPCSRVVICGPARRIINIEDRRA